MYVLVSDQDIKLSKTMYEINFVDLVKLPRVMYNSSSTGCKIAAGYVRGQLC